MNEAESKRHLLEKARKLGIERDIQAIYDKYEMALKKCTNPVERKQIALMGVVELHKAINCSGPLVVGGQEILPGDPTSSDDTLFAGAGKVAKL